MKYNKIFSEDKIRKNDEQIKQKTKLATNTHVILNTHADEYLQQQLVGNTLVLKGSTAQHVSCVQDKILQELQIQCILNGKEMLWSTFNRLTVGQKYSFLADMFNLSEDSYQLPKEHNWLEWEKRISRLSAMSLEPEESYKEVRSPESQITETFYEMSVEEFTSPYREIWMWLNYKGNHQNKIDILRRLSQLSLDRKKWFIHKLMLGQKITGPAFALELTVIKYEQVYVDWERIQQELDDLFIKSDQDIASELEQFNSTKAKAAESITNLQNSGSEDNSSHKGEEDKLPPFSLFDNKKLAKKDSLLKQWCESVDSLSLLLFNQNHNIQKRTSKITKVNIMVFVDRLLTIPIGKRVDSLSKNRDQLLRLYGFVSPIACATYCMEQIAYILYEKGIVQRDESYKQLIMSLGFTKDAFPNQEQLLKKLYELYLG